VVKALDPLAVAEQDILALHTARENSAALRRPGKRERASPFQSTRDRPVRHRRHPHTSPSLLASTRFSVLVHRQSEL